jgi:hypothetical protein
MRSQSDDVAKADLTFPASEALRWKWQRLHHAVLAKNEPYRPPMLADAATA